MGRIPNGEIPPAKGGKMFSPLEESILRVATDQWQTANQFAELTGQKCNHFFYAILSNLVDREWLQGCRSGYRKRPD